MTFDTIKEYKEYINDYDGELVWHVNKFEARHKGKVIASVDFNKIFPLILNVHFQNNFIETEQEFEQLNGIL